MNTLRTRGARTSAFDYTSSRAVKKRRLLAGVRCHERFYNLLTRGSQQINAGRPGAAAARPLVRALGTAVDCRREILKTGVICEIDLGPRRPDCVIYVRRASPVPHLLFLVELKSCLHTRDMATRTKALQRLEGLGQLRDARACLGRLTPPGPEPLLICPVLIFVAQKGLRILAVQRLPTVAASVHFDRLLRVLLGRSCYHVRTAPGSPLDARSQRSGARGVAQPAKPAAAPKLPSVPRSRSNPRSAGPRRSLAGQRRAARPKVRGAGSHGTAGGKHFDHRSGSNNAAGRAGRGRFKNRRGPGSRAGGRALPAN
uniref:UL24 n=1 Tax=Fibropapilloma-associated turtle herpesvirus TaxID=256817 RepID=Q5Y964_9ALPH|nr:UL24 [Fibropapilloma-associated turtle herpesvirus]